MAENLIHLRVFVASPSDVPDERRVLEGVINEYNRTWAKTLKVHLDLIKWETHTYPAIGDDAQEVINRQVGDDYDILLGIMWGRFGSSTGRAESGTEEEFNRAYRRSTSSPGSVQIMFYFKDAPIRRSEMDLEQLSKVDAFQRRIAAEHGVLYDTFETTEEFRTKVLFHLSKVVQDYLAANPKVSAATTVRIAAPTSDIVDPLANLTALTDDDYDDGLIELSERANDAIAMVSEIVMRMSDATTELAGKFQERTAEVNRLTAGGSVPDMKSAKRVSNNAAKDLEVYVNRLSAEIPPYQEQHVLAMDTFGRIAMISHEDLDEDVEDIKMAMVQIQKYRDVISTSSGSLVEFRGSIVGLPRMTTAFNRARRRASAVMDDLLEQLRAAGSQSEDVIQLLKRMTDMEDGDVQ